jgi:hypothetical protein
MELPDERPVPSPAEAAHSASDDAAMLAAPELPAPAADTELPGEPDIGKLWWLIVAVVVLAVVYFMVR